MNDSSRIVVFADDLDRCTPERALEVLESIKGFFDIEGIIYVIGMNYNSIDTIIEKKYGKQEIPNQDNQNSKITGFDYMEKIIQLPFQLPLWTESDICAFIRNIMDKDLKDTNLEKSLSEDENKNVKGLLVKAAKLNPREAKMFLNHIVFTNAVFSKLPIDELIVVQALNFRRDWNKFLEFILPDENRRFFLQNYQSLKTLKDRPVMKRSINSLQMRLILTHHSKAIRKIIPHS